MSRSKRDASTAPSSSARYKMPRSPALRGRRCGGGPMGSLATSGSVRVDSMRSVRASSGRRPFQLIGESIEVEAQVFQQQPDQIIHAPSHCQPRAGGRRPGFTYLPSTTGCHVRGRRPPRVGLTESRTRRARGHATVAPWHRLSISSRCRSGARRRCSPPRRSRSWRSNPARRSSSRGAGLERVGVGHRLHEDGARGPRARRQYRRHAEHGRRAGGRSSRAHRGHAVPRGGGLHAAWPRPCPAGQVFPNAAEQRVGPDEESLPVAPYMAARNLVRLDMDEHSSRSASSSVRTLRCSPITRRARSRVTCSSCRAACRPAPRTSSGPRSPMRAPPASPRPRSRSTATARHSRATR